jgi:phage/plasmid-like protein (TIGR03299 family)
MHDLDINQGQASFVSAHTMGWHQLGNLLDHSFTAEEAMEHGLLGGWNVRKAPVFTVDPGTGLQIPMPGQAAVIRDNPVSSGIDVLTRKTVGEDYRIVQNEEHADFLNTLVDESGAHFDTAGALDGGRRVFVTMEMPGHVSIGGVDQVKNYIAAINSHDGSMAFTLMVTPVRIVCANTLNLAFQDNSHIYRVRHTSGMEKALRTQARKALDFTFNYLDGFQAQAEELINKTLTQGQFEDIIAKEFGPTEDSSPAAVTRAEKKVEEMSDLFAEAQTQEGIRDTAWAGLNALTEWADHFAPTRGEDRDLSRATKSIMDPSFKNRALDLMLAV